MRHRANSMMAFDSTSTSNSEHAWFVDSGASHHMTSHQEWFRDLRMPDQPGYIETVDNTPHPIRHIGGVPFRKEGKNLHQECLACAHNNKEFGLGRPNRGARHASSLQQRRWPTHSQGTERQTSSCGTSESAT